MRIVSLVPSLTETVHDLGLGGSLVGVTKFCVRPVTARDTAAVIGGTKDPDVERIRQLRPELVLADEDENKPDDLRALRDAGINVHVTGIETVNDVARELRSIGLLLGVSHEAEKYAGDLQEKANQLAGAAHVGAPLACFVPIWKRPLMTMGRRTYMSDLLRTLGGRNVFDDAEKKYFEVATEEVRVREPDAILLPTEPYRFRESDRGGFAERFEVPLDAVRIVDGQAFTWFGTHSIRGLDVLAESLAAVRGQAKPASR
ncbi:MAG TPA: helical backbone metal receptor [Candidatus Thermoplasmatota archaeon]|nr:helical backbone metal receptor [Candidatus Thermoplasmatota archaeon]